MRLALLFLLALPALSQTCSPLTAAASGIDNVFPAVPSSGVDGISWDIARAQWTCTADSTQRRITYGTSSGVYTVTTGQQTVPTTAGNITGAIISNLIPSTTYFFKAGSFISGSWVETAEQTFTTLAKPLGVIIYATLPIAVDTTRPTITGTDWIYGSTCGTSGTVLARLQDCLDAMHVHGSTGATADSLGLPGVAQGGPSVYPISQVNLHNSELAIGVTCTIGGSCIRNDAGTAPTNGTKVILGSDIFGSVPSPINPGIPYYVVNSSGSSFKLSTTSGGAAISLLETGTTVDYLPFPLTQAKMVIHSTAAANLLPPVGVRLGPDALAQYLPNMPILEAIDPILGAGGRSYIQYAPLTMNLVWENVGFSVDGSVATSNTNNSHANPQAFPSPIQIGLTNANIGYDQCAFLHPGAPTRIASVTWNGVGNYFVNGYSALDWWQPHYAVPSGVTMSISGNVITIPAANISYVGAAGTKVTCAIPAGTVTISGGGTGYLFLWTNADCTQGGSLTPGLSATTTISGLTISNAASGGTISTIARVSLSALVTATTSSAHGFIVGQSVVVNNVTDPSFDGIVTVASIPGANQFTYFQGGPNATSSGGTASPGYPAYLYTSPTGFTQTNLSAIPLGFVFNITSGTITSSNGDISSDWSDIGESSQRAEGSSGFEIAGYGPFKFDNNYIQGEGIGGIFWADDLTLDGTPCGGANPCTVQTIIGNLTVSRNTITTDPVHFFYDSASWDGGNRYWRNANEQKAGRFSLWDGNRIGPWSAQVGEGQCALHEEFENQFIQVGNYPAYANASDWTYIFNTCLNMPTTGITTAYSFQSPWVFGYPISNMLIQDNLFLNNNAYAQVAANQPFRSDGHVVPDPTSGQCPQGQLMFLAQSSNFVYDHNSEYGRGGCQSFLANFVSDYSSAQITNSVLNLVNDPGPFSSNLAPGILFSTGSPPYLSGSCSAPTGAANTFACMHNFTWAGNVLLYTWTNSLPGSQVDFTTSGISTNQAGWSGFASLLPTGNTLAARTAFGQWFNLPTGNARYAAASPYISGAHQTTDGLDVGANIDQLAVHQGAVSNVRVLAKTSTSFTLGFYAPDSFACGVDWSTNAFSTWTRVAGVAGSPDPRVQSVAVTGVTAHASPTYRLNCAVVQPTGTIQLP